MARRARPSRSGDLVVAVQLADRTGIVAASAPPAVPASTELVDTRIWVFAGPVQPGERSRAAGRIRTRVLFSCAAMLFLVAGWIGGGTFAHSDVEPAPAVAAGVLAGHDKPDRVPAPVMTSEAPKPARPAPAPSAKPSSDAATGVGRAQPVKSSLTAQPNGGELLVKALPAAQAPVTGVLAQFQRLIGSSLTSPINCYGMLMGQRR